jgi:H+/Cl- antiporter ClcA
VSASLLTWSVIVGPLIGLIASGYIRLIGYVSHHQVSGWRILVALPGACVLLGVVGIAYPELFGNGKDMAQAAFLGRDAIALLAALAVLKPVVTALCLGAGASGGLLTPTLSTGAALGGLLGSAWNLMWPIPGNGAFALVGATAMMGAAMQAPLTAMAMIVELIHGGTALLVPMILATVGAAAVARRIDGYSIYSARLAARPAGGDQ